MTHQERFVALMNYQPFDRVPVYYFGLWTETLERWRAEGIEHWSQVPSLSGMDPDWEMGLWDNHGMAPFFPHSDKSEVVLETGDGWEIVHTSLGAVIKRGTSYETIPQTIEEGLKPTRDSWRRFTQFLNPDDAAHRPAGWEKMIPIMRNRGRVANFMAGSLFGLPREWMGPVEWSYLSYDDPALYEEIIEFVADYFLALNRPFLEQVKFEIAYFFEDCCFNSGPLISPEMYRKYYHKHYVRMIEEYRRLGMNFMLIDSDGKVDDLVPCWLESGFDIIFPIEVGTWKADPHSFRKEYGKAMRMMGGVNKHCIPRGETAIRAELEPLRDLVAEGGFIPLPDHRIPPDTSFKQFCDYVRIFKNVFGVGE